MGNSATGPGHKLTTQDRVDRWWPVAVAIAAATVLPLLGVPFALVMAYLRRSDRRVMVTLLVIAALGALLLRVVMGAGGDGAGMGS